MDYKEVFKASMLSIISTIIVTCITGFMLTKFWSWFIVPIFHLPEISVPLAIGLRFTIRFITFQKKNDDKIDYDKFTIEKVAKGFKTDLFTYCVMFLIGVIVMNCI